MHSGSIFGPGLIKLSPPARLISEIWAIFSGNKRPMTALPKFNAKAMPIKSHGSFIFPIKLTKFFHVEKRTFFPVIIVSIIN